MKTMAEVLEEHGWQCASRRAACYCGWGIPKGYYPRGTVQAHAAHQQDMLTAAGFGLVADAKAEAWDEGCSFGSLYDCIFRSDNPYRTNE